MISEISRFFLLYIPHWFAKSTRKKWVTHFIKRQSRLYLIVELIAILLVFNEIAFSFKWFFQAYVSREFVHYLCNKFQDTYLKG